MSHVASEVNRPSPAEVRALARVAWGEEPTEALMVRLYHIALRKPLEGTYMPAVIAHRGACGIVAYLLGVHPTAVSDAVVAERARAAA